MLSAAAPSDRRAIVAPASRQGYCARKGNNAGGFMFRLGVGAVCAALLCGSLIGGPAFAKDCTRHRLQAAVDSYIAAQTKGDPSLMALASPFKYVENRKDADLEASVLKSPQKIDFHRSLFDTKACETFTEVIITDPAHPYVLGINLRLKGHKIAAIHALVTDEGDWFFSPASALKYSPAEDWGVIPKKKRDSRETLRAAANAYLDRFSDKTVQVPWGTPCRRLEGGLYFGTGAPDDSCNVGVPDNVPITERHFVVDPDIGAVVGLVLFGAQSDAAGLPDSHLFRVEGGKLRFVHTITVCSTFNCGFPLPKQLGGTGELRSPAQGFGTQAGAQAQPKAP